MRAKLPPPTMFERAEAARAARALRGAIANRATMGSEQTLHMDLSRPRRGVWITTWTNLPGFKRENGRYTHTCLPGWEYARNEIVAEMIPDLELLAERGERPAQATQAA